MLVATLNYPERSCFHISHMRTAFWTREQPHVDVLWARGIPTTRLTEYFSKHSKTISTRDQDNDDDDDNGEDERLGADADDNDCNHRLHVFSLLHSPVTTSVSGCFLTSNYW